MLVAYSTREALDFTVQHAVSEASGGRPNASKIAVIVIVNESEDSLDAAAHSASINRVLLLPIVVGDRYNTAQLTTLAGPSATNRIITLRRFEELSAMVASDDRFVRKLCAATVPECIDEEGNKKTPGDKWTLLDQCHTVMCLPGGFTFLESHRINCERMPRPLCRNNMPAVRVEETCGCRWVCPCTCMGSSTKHIVTFDGLDFKLTGNCSYTLFDDKKHDIQVVLHNGACSSTPKLNCMNSIEVTHQSISVKLFSNMSVTVNDELSTLPYNNDHFEVNDYGAIMHEIRFSRLGHIISFTPSNNEFTFQLSPKSFASQTYGLCGICDQNSNNDFILKDGSIAPDSGTFVQEWAITQPGTTCEVNRADRCTEHATTECSILLSNQFYGCHHIVPPNPFYEACEENNCHGDEVCEIVSSYAHLCRTQGICVEWRTPEFCRKNSIVYYRKCNPLLFLLHVALVKGKSTKWPIYFLNY
ncbi:UNVERIFIED_CONTAM: hypothetical protein K2H54_023427 [Gekko kuhli]